MWDVEAVLENSKLAIVERLELQISFNHPNHDEGQIKIIFSGKFSGILQKPKCHL